MMMILTGRGILRGRNLQRTNKKETAVLVGGEHIRKHQDTQSLCQRQQAPLYVSEEIKNG